MSSLPIDLREVEGDSAPQLSFHLPRKTMRGTPLQIDLEISVFSQSSQIGIRELVLPEEADAPFGRIALSNWVKPQGTTPRLSDTLPMSIETLVSVGFRATLENLNPRLKRATSASTSI
jgi:hypothetical protein